MRRIFQTLALIMLCLSSNVSNAQVKANPRPAPSKMLKPIPQNPDLVKAQALESDGKFEEAQAIYKRVYETDGTDNAFWKLLLLTERAEDYEEMEKVVRLRLKRFPDDMSMKRYLARSFYGRDNKKKGRKILLDIIGGNYRDIGKVYLVTNELTRQKEYDTVRDIYIRVRKTLKRPDLFANEMARLYNIRMEYIKSIEEYLQMIDKVKITPVNISKLIDMALKEDYQAIDIAKPLANHLKENPKSIETARILSNLLYGVGDYEGAYTALVPAAVVTQSPQDVWTLAARLKNDGVVEMALRGFGDYYRYFEKDPKRVAALMEIATIMTENGDTQGALDAYRKLAEDYKGTRQGESASLKIIQISADTMGFDSYIAALEEFAATSRVTSVIREAHLVRGDTFMRKGLHDKAKAAYALALTKSRSSRDKYGIGMRSAYLAFYTDDYETMAKEIEICVGTYPDAVEVNDLLTLKVLGLRCSSGVDRESLAAYAEGKYALYRGETTEAESRFMLAAADTSSVISPYAASDLARLHLQNGETDQAVTWFLNAAASSKDQTERAGAYLNAADVLAGVPDGGDRAESLYREALLSAHGSVYENEIRRKLITMVEE